MKTHHLCPVYCKYLQLNPALARHQRSALLQQTQFAHVAGELPRAMQLGYYAFEAAKAALAALQTVSPDDDKPVKDDVIAFAAMAMYLARLLNKSGDGPSALQVLQEGQQMLLAIMPLHATTPSVCSLISSFKQTLEAASHQLTNSPLIDAQISAVNLH